MEPENWVLRTSLSAVLGSQYNTPLLNWLNSSKQSGLVIFNKINRKT